MKRQPNQCATSRKAAALFIACATLLAACNGSSSKPSPNAKAGSSTDKVLKFRADNTPILSGISIKVVNAASSPHVGDTHVYSMVQFLKKWGATVSLTNAGGSESELAVKGGSEDVACSEFAPALDAGLTVFGPNQAAVDYVLFAKKSITSVSQLKGASFGVSYISDASYPLIVGILQQNGLNISDVHLVFTGSDTSAFSGVLAGRIDATFEHSSAIPTAGNKLNVLASGGQALPGYADSFMAARPNWITDKPAVAEAVDLAWFAAAKEFDSNESAWTADATAFTQGAQTKSDVESAYTQLKAIQAWPLSQSAITPAGIATNYGIAKQLKTINGLGVRPAPQLSDLGPWNAAWQYFSVHEGSY